MSDSRSDYLEIPQVPPVLQVEALALYENDLPELPTIRAANVDILRFTCALLQLGQETSATASAVRKSSSKGVSHSVQTYSKIGIKNS